jgi:hypothetical protein
MIRCMVFGNLVNYGSSLLENYCRRRHTEPTIKPSSFQNLHWRGKKRRKEKSVADLGRSKQ